MNLIYGTNNPSKLKSMIKILDGLNLNVTGLESLNMGLEEAKETAVS